MAKRKKKSVSGSYQLLLHVPKHAIVDRLLKSPADDVALNVAYRELTGKAATASRTNLVDLTIQELTRLFEAVPTTNEDDARKLHNEWRYRGMKSLYLYRYAGTRPNPTQMLDDLKEALAATAPAAGASLPDIDPQLQFDAVEKVRLPHTTLIEVRYRYVAVLNYIDPNDEEAKSVDDLRQGFAWICEPEQWAAISARDLDTRDRIAECLRATTSATLTPLTFSKDVVSRLESEARRRRVALVDPQSRTTRRYTGKNLGQDSSAQTEIQQRWNQDDAPFNGFEVDVNAHTMMVLGYNNRHGKIFFSKDLTASQLHEWGPTKINDILESVNDTIRSRPTFRQQVIAPFLRKLPVSTRAAASELIAAVAACKQGNVSEHELDHPVLHLRSELGRLANAVLYVMRDDTEEVADLCCPDSQSERIGLSRDGGRLECSDCQTSLNLRKVPVVDGTRLRIRDLNDAVQLLPTNELLAPILQGAAAITGLPTNLDEEFFFVRGRTLVYRRLTGNVVVTLEDLPELRHLLNGSVPASRRKPIQTALAQFKEKCRRMSLKNCASCVQNRVGEKCFLRLFGLVDPSFTPQPHGSIEYGDYARLVTVDGHADRYLVVLMKRASKKQGPITSSCREGREILEQAFKYMQAAMSSACPCRDCCMMV